MAAIALKKQKAKKDTVGKVKNLSGDSVFVKKANEAKAFLKKNGLPFTKKK